MKLLFYNNNSITLEDMLFRIPERPPPAAISLYPRPFCVVVLTDYLNLKQPFVACENVHKTRSRRVEAMAWPANKNDDKTEVVVGSTRDFITPANAFFQQNVLAQTIKSG